jgi:hypothetical protein
LLGRIECHRRKSAFQRSRLSEEATTDYWSRYNCSENGFRDSVTIIESRERLSAGLAYSTSVDQHLLNVPAEKMSAPPPACQWTAWKIAGTSRHGLGTPCGCVSQASGCLLLGTGLTAVDLAIRKSSHLDVSKWTFPLNSRGVTATPRLDHRIAVDRGQER